MIRHASSWCRSAVALIAVLAGALAAAPAHAAPLPSAAVLQDDADGIRAAGNVGVLAHAVDGGEHVRVRAGTAWRGTAIPVPWTARFRTGSNTKTMVATVVLQLVAEGRLSLEDPVERWLPGVLDGNGYDGSAITVRQLLQHTSGIYDYVQDERFLATILTPEGFKANRFRHYEPHELIAMGLAHPPLFAPGADWSYSNTNYILIGQIIQAVTGHTWARELQARIVAPLHLTGTSVPGDNPFILGPHAKGYNIFTSDPTQRAYTDTTVDNMTWADAAGSVITTTEDERRFLSALLSGRLLPPAQLAEMQRVVEIVPGVGYGLGMLHERLTCSDGSTADFWGHTGGVVGYASYVLGTVDGQRTLVLLESTTTFSDEQYLNDDAVAVGTMITDVFCGASPAVADQRVSAPATPRVLDLTRRWGPIR